jgi:hypothetical protein
MKTLSELLGDADPVRHEPPPGVHDRRVMRDAILKAPRATGVPARRRPLAIVALVALPLVGLAVGYWARGAADVIAAVRFEARLAEETPTLGLRAVAVPGTTRSIYLHAQPIVTNSDIAQARIVDGDRPSTYHVAITFTADGAAKMLRATRGHLDRPIAILLDGEVAMAPTVRSPVAGSAVISGDFTRAEVERIVSGIVGR